MKHKSILYRIFFVHQVHKHLLIFIALTLRAIFK